MSSLPTNDQITSLLLVIIYYFIRLYLVGFEQTKRIARAELDFFFQGSVSRLRSAYVIVTRPRPAYANFNLLGTDIIILSPQSVDNNN